MGPSVRQQRGKAGRIPHEALRRRILFFHVRLTRRRVCIVFAQVQLAPLILGDDAVRGITEHDYGASVDCEYHRNGQLVRAEGHRDGGAILEVLLSAADAGFRNVNHDVRRILAILATHPQNHTQSLSTFTQISSPDSLTVTASAGSCGSPVNFRNRIAIGLAARAASALDALFRSIKALHTHCPFRTVTSVRRTPVIFAVVPVVYTVTGLHHAALKSARTSLWQSGTGNSTLSDSAVGVYTGVTVVSVLDCATHTSHGHQSWSCGHETAGTPRR